MKAVGTGRRAEAGFSLIELVLAMGLLAVALTAVYGLQAANLDLHTEARFVTRAAQLARAQLAQARARLDSAGEAESGRFDEEDGVTPDWGWERRIEEVPDRPGLYRIRVRVFLESPSGTGGRDVVVESLAYGRPD